MATLNAQQPRTMQSHSHQGRIAHAPTYLPTSTCQVGPIRFSVRVLIKHAILSSSKSGKFLLAMESVSGW
jgi:hypothetical protein